MPTPRRRLLHTFDYWQSYKIGDYSCADVIKRNIRRPDLSRLAWTVTSLSPTRQGEFLATQNPDGSLVLSAVLNDEHGLLSFLLVPPAAQRTPPRQRNAGPPGAEISSLEDG